MGQSQLTTFGQHIRTLRERAELPLRKVAAELNIDPSLLGKIERNERHPTKEFIKQVSRYYKINPKMLSNEYLSDQIAYKILDEEADIEILKVAEEKVHYLKTSKKK
jgi:transcriptional regulator with XRE-family HTH domain